ncbi:MAG: T9SS type A sorting domain-containing protein, partial [Bacteroidota bacterium]
LYRERQNNRLDLIALSLDAFSTEGNFDNLTFSGGSGVNFFFVNPNSLSSGVPTDFILYGSALPGERTVTITGTDTATGIECSWEITFTAPACGGPLLDPCPGVEMNSSQVSCLGYDKDGNPRYQFQTTLKGTDRYRQGYLVPGKTQSENIFEQVVIDPRNGIVSGILKDVAPFNNTLCVRLALSQVEGQFCEVDLCMDSKGNCSEGDRPILNQLGQQTVLDESIQLFPNPAQDQIQIAWNAALLSGPLNLQIQSPEGRSWQMERADARQGQHWMDVSQLSPGLYVLMIREGEVLVAAKRLVIIR